MPPEQYTRVDIDPNTRDETPGPETKARSIASALQDLPEVNRAYLEAAFNQLGLNSVQEEIASLAADAPEQLAELESLLSSLGFAVDEVAKRQAAKRIAEWVRVAQG